MPWIISLALSGNHCQRILKRFRSIFCSVKETETSRSASIWQELLRVLLWRILASRSLGSEDYKSPDVNARTFSAVWHDDREIIVIRRIPGWKKKDRMRESTPGFAWEFFSSLKMESLHEVCRNTMTASLKSVLQFTSIAVIVSSSPTNGCQNFVHSKTTQQLPAIS